MRRALCRWLLFGACLVPLVGASAVAQPPMVPPGGASEKLKADTAALAADRAAVTDASSERAKLMADLRRLLKEISSAPHAVPGPPMPPPGPAPKTIDVNDGKAVDRLREATNLVRAGQFEAALRAFRLIDVQTLGREDRAFARYMTAACLRRLGRPAEAVPIYREVADAGDDEFVSTSAVTQLSLIRTAEELEAQLAQLLRARPKSK